MIALSPQGGLNSKGAYTFPSPSYVYEYDPTDQSWTDVTPGRKRQLQDEVAAADRRTR